MHFNSQPLQTSNSPSPHTSKHPTHTRDWSWSTCSDSDVKSGSMFSGSDVANVRSTSARLFPHQQHRSTTPNDPQYHINGQRRFSHDDVKKTLQQLPLKGRKHVTFQNAIGIDPLKRHTESNRPADSKQPQQPSDSIVCYDDDVSRTTRVMTSPTQARVSRSKVAVVSAQRRAKSETRHTMTVTSDQACRRSPLLKQTDRLIADVIIHHNAMTSSPSPANSSHPAPQSPIVTSARLSPSVRHNSASPCSFKSMTSWHSKRSTTRGHSRRRAPADMNALDDDVMKQVFSYLSSDDLCRCSGVSRRWHVLAFEPSLWKRIEIRSNSDVDIDRALKVLTRRLSRDTPTVCVSVEQVFLSGCRRLSDKGVYTIARRCPELRQLDVSSCPDVTNIAIFELVSRCVNLETLNLAGALILQLIDHSCLV